MRQLGDYTPSDSGPWLTQWDLEEQAHVVPGFGPKHFLAWTCWCHPVFDDDYSEPVISHNVAN